MSEPRVIRHRAGGRTVTMVRANEAFEEPEFRADVYDEQGRFIATVGNSTLLCLPTGSIRAIYATDIQILEAVLNDEPI